MTYNITYIMIGSNLKKPTLFEYKQIISVYELFTDNFRAAIHGSGFYANFSFQRFYCFV